MIYVLLVWGYLGNGSSVTPIAHYQSQEACTAAGKEWQTIAGGDHSSAHFACIPASSR